MAKKFMQTVLVADALAELHRHHGRGRVVVVGRADGDGVDFLRHLVEHLAVVVVELRLRVLLGGFGVALVVDVAQPDDVLGVSPGEDQRQAGPGEDRASRMAARGVPGHGGEARCGGHCGPRRVVGCFGPTCSEGHDLCFAGWSSGGLCNFRCSDDIDEESCQSSVLVCNDIEPDEVDSIKRSAQAPVSLEKPVGDEEESEFGQFIADERAESPYERAAEILTKEALREALENLSYRERRVLELRYGLGGEHPRTLDEVGRTFNVTRERIRQIENQSLKKLQSLAEAQKLRDVA